MCCPTKSSRRVGSSKKTAEFMQTIYVEYLCRILFRIIRVVACGILSTNKKTRKIGSLRAAFGRRIKRPGRSAPTPQGSRENPAGWVPIWPLTSVPTGPLWGMLIIMFKDPERERRQSKSGRQ